MKFARSRDHLAELCRYLKSTFDKHIPQDHYYRQNSDRRRGHTPRLVYRLNMKHRRHSTTSPRRIVSFRHTSKKERKMKKRNRDRTRQSIQVHIARLIEGRNGAYNTRYVARRSPTAYRCAKGKRSQYGQKRRKKKAHTPWKLQAYDQDTGAMSTRIEEPIILPTTETDLNETDNTSDINEDVLNGNIPSIEKTTDTANDADYTEDSEDALSDVDVHDDAGTYTDTDDETSVAAAVNKDFTGDDLSTAGTLEKEDVDTGSVDETHADNLEVFPNLPQNEDNLISSPSLESDLAVETDIVMDKSQSNIDVVPPKEDTSKSSTSTETDYNFSIDTDLDKYLSSSSSGLDSNPGTNALVEEKDLKETELDDLEHDNRFVVKSEFSFDTDDPQYIKYIRDERLSTARDEVRDNTRDREEPVDYIDIPVASTNDDEYTNTHGNHQTPPSSLSCVSQTDDVPDNTCMPRTPPRTKLPSNSSKQYTSTVKSLPANQGQSKSNCEDSSLDKKVENQIVSVNTRSDAKMNKKEAGKKVLLSKLAKRIKSANLEMRIQAMKKTVKLIDRCKSDSAAKHLTTSVVDKTPHKEKSANQGRQAFDSNCRLKGNERLTNSEAMRMSKTSQNNGNINKAKECRKGQKKIRRKKHDEENDAKLSIDCDVLTDVEMRKHVKDVEEHNEESDGSISSESSSDSFKKHATSACDKLKSRASATKSRRSEFSERTLSSTPPRSYSSDDSLYDDSDDSTKGKLISEPSPRRRMRSPSISTDTDLPVSGIPKAQAFISTKSQSRRVKITPEQISTQCLKEEKTTVGKPKTGKTKVTKKSSRKLHGSMSANRSQPALSNVPPRFLMYIPNPTCTRTKGELQRSSATSYSTQRGDAATKRPSTAKPWSAMQLMQGAGSSTSKLGRKKRNHLPANDRNLVQVKTVEKPLQCAGIRRRKGSPHDRNEEPRSGAQKTKGAHGEEASVLRLNRTTSSNKNKSKIKQNQPISFDDKLVSRGVHTEMPIKQEKHCRKSSQTKHSKTDFGDYGTRNSRTKTETGMGSHGPCVN